MATILSGLQENDKQKLMAFLQPSDPFLPINQKTIILFGPRGTGKRTLINSIAREFNLSLTEVICRDKRHFDIGLDGFADVLNSSNEIDGISISGYIVYLSEFNATPDDILQEIQMLIEKKAFLDKNGKFVKLPNTVCVIAGVTTDEINAQRISEEHWLCSKFDHKLNITLPSRGDDISQLCYSILEANGIKMSIEDDALQIISKLVGPPDWLIGLNRWIIKIKTRCEPAGSISRLIIESIVEDEVHEHLKEMLFRGQTLSIEKYRNWADQFPNDISHLAFRMIMCISERYFIHIKKYYEAIEEMIRLSGIGINSSVAFCNWQHVGHSAPSITNQLKNMGHWFLKDDIDLLSSPDNWPSYDDGLPQFILLVDDFVGSGDTLVGVFKSGIIDQLLKTYPNVNIVLMVIGGFESGLRMVNDAIKKTGSAIKLVVPEYFIFNEKDSCFYKKSRIIQNLLDRKQLIQFCKIAAQDKMQLKPSMACGYKNMGSLVVYPDSVPNNTIPLIWCTKGDWIPLFPASGLP